MAEMEKEKSAGQLLEEELMWKFPHIGKEAPEQNEEANAFWRAETAQRGWIRGTR